MRKALLFIVLMSIFLRFYNLEVIPEWHSDEGENLSIAKNLMDGKLQLFAFKYAFIPRLPLFFVVSGAIMEVFGYAMLNVRLLSAFYGILTTILVYLIGRELWNDNVGLLASFLFSIHPLTVTYNRMAITHNQMMLLTALLLFCFLKYLNSENKEKWFLLVCLTVSLALISEFTALALMVPLSFLIFIYDRKRLKLIFLTILPFCVFLISMMLLYSDYFLQDISINFNYNFRDVGQSYPAEAVAYLSLMVLMAIVMHIGKYDRFFLLFIILIFSSLCGIFGTKSEFQLYALDYTTILGAIGLIMIPDIRKKITILSFFIPLFILLFSALPYAHRIIPLSIYTAIGMSVLFYRAFFQVPKNKVELIFFVFVLLLSLHVMGLILRADFEEVLKGQSLGVEPLEVDNKVINFLLRNTKESDFVVIPSSLIHLTNENATNMLQAMGCEGRHTPYYPMGVRERFTFNCSYKNAKYVVISDKHKEWLVNISHGDTVSEITGWPNLEVGKYNIYKNPEKNE